MHTFSAVHTPAVFQTQKPEDNVTLGEINGNATPKKQSVQSVWYRGQSGCDKERW